MIIRSDSKRQTNRRRAGILGAITGLAVLAAACGTATAAPSDSASDTVQAGKEITVVASTDVWGSIAQVVGGDAVTVVSFIDDPNTDPHSFQANAHDQLALTKADLIIENGGGYDDFMQTMIKASAHPSTPVINAVELSGHTGDDVNEHVWYDLPTVVTVADAIADRLAAVDPAHATAFRSNATGFGAQIGRLIEQESRIKAEHAGTPVAITEPVPLYMLEACGLVNMTPEDFSKAVEDGTDASPLALMQTLKLFSAKKVVALFYNEQTSDTQTNQVMKAATAGGVAVVPVAETLPSGLDFVNWMQGYLEAISTVVSR